MFVLLSLLLLQPSDRVIDIQCDDLLRFDITTIRVKEGEKITLRLTNVGKIPNLKHNWVLLAKDTNPDRFASAAMAAKSEDYIPAKLKDQIIAATKLASSGQTVSVQFTAPAKGEYRYMCSYPGHGSVSKGRLIVE